MNTAQGNPLQGMGQQQSVFNNMRLAKVWVAYRAAEAPDDEPTSALSPPDIFGVFPTKALADIFLAGAEAADPGMVAIVEMPINYGG